MGATLVSGSGSSDAGTNADASFDAQADGEPLDGGTGPCVDIHILPSMLPEPEKWFLNGPPMGVFGDRDHFWRDANGLHVAWNVCHANGNDCELVVSSFDAMTGALKSQRFFAVGGTKRVGATGIAPTGTIGISVGVSDADGGPGFHALLLIRTDDPDYEKLYPLPTGPDPGNYSPVGVGWDGEAFAVHLFGEGNVQYVTRIQEDGTVLLPPTAFGHGVGYVSEIRYATDPVSGMTVAASGVLADFPWLTGHTRDGTPLPDATKIQAVELEPQNWKGAEGGWWGSTTHPAIVPIAGGAGVAWSSTGGAPVSTFLQGLGSNLTPNADAIGIPGEPLPPPSLPGFYDGYIWLTVQPHPGGGWWVAGTNSTTINEFVVDEFGKASRRALVTYSKAPQAGFMATDFESVRWNDEIWLAFMDRSSSVAQPFRVVRAHPACTYAIMKDLVGQ